MKRTGVAELGAILGSIAALIAGAGAGVALRRRRNARIWTIEDKRGNPLRVVGPYRNAHGQIEAMRTQQQSAWSAEQGGRLPTADEFDRIWRTADVRVPFRARDVTSAPLTSGNDDAIAAGASAGDRIAGGKTWVNAAPETTYGAFVPAADTQWSAELNHQVSQRIGTKVYPAVTSTGDLYVVQPPSTFHDGQNHGDYSQWGYAVVPM